MVMLAQGRNLISLSSGMELRDAKAIATQIADQLVNAGLSFDQALDVLTVVKAVLRARPMSGVSSGGQTIGC